MLKILNAFYNGTISPIEFAPPKTEKYKTELQQSIDLRLELTKTLKPEQIELLDDYVSMSMLASSRINEQQFWDGVAVGLMICEELEEHKQNILSQLRNL